MLQRERIAGGLYGLLVGDALGVPYEFYEAKELPVYEKIEMTPPAGFQKTYPKIAAGTWSDDGAQALCLLDSLSVCGRFCLGDFSDRLLEWYEEGKWAVDGEVFDVGIQTGPLHSHDSVALTGIVTPWAVQIAQVFFRGIYCTNFECHPRLLLNPRC